MNKKALIFLTPILIGSLTTGLWDMAVNSANPTPPNGDSNWKLVFSDDFEGTSLNTQKWSYNYPWGNTHNHRAYCAPENVSVSDGILRIKGENKKHPNAPAKVEQGGEWHSLDYTAGAVNTKDKFNFTTGYIEGRFKVPDTKGFWPAFWTLNANTGWPPEIDILEILCHNPKELHTNYHYGQSWDNKSSHYQKFTVTDLSKDFHTYGVEWTSNSMSWYLDGKKLGTTFGNKQWIDQAKDMYLIINLAVGGWEDDPDNTTRWPSYYECDWVRVWQKTEVEINSPFLNGDLESGSLSPWTKWNDASIVNNNQRSGNYCLRVGNAPASIEQVVTVKPNTTYTFSGYGKTLSGQEVLIGVKNHGGSQITSPISSTTYKEGSVTFTTGAANTSATLFFYHDNGSGDCYGDDFKLEAKSFTSQPQNTPSPLKSPTYSPSTTPLMNLGDLDGDRVITSTDYAILKRYILGITKEFQYPWIYESADVNKSGDIDSTDYALIKRYLLGLIKNF